MQGMVSCKTKPPFLDLSRSMSAQHGETYRATWSWHSVWTMFGHLATEFRLIFLALVWHGSLQWGSLCECLKKSPLQKKEPGTPRNVSCSSPIGRSDVPGFRVVSTIYCRIILRTNQKHRNAGTVVKWQFFVEIVQKRRLQQGFCQSYSWSPVPGRAGFSSAHWILWGKLKLW